MKIKSLFVVLVLVLASCASVAVKSDYDSTVDFSTYKTYAFFKNSIDNAEMSDLDKKRILRSIDEVMPTKGMTKSENPDVLISIFSSEKEKISTYNTYGYAPRSRYYGVNGLQTSVHIEGTLYIDILDAKTKELLWQGQGTGFLTKNNAKKDAQAKQFVTEILEQYPPVKK